MQHFSYFLQLFRLHLVWNGKLSISRVFAGAGGVTSVTFYGCSLNNLYFIFFLGGLLLVNELS